MPELFCGLKSKSNAQAASVIGEVSDVKSKAVSVRPGICTSVGIIRDFAGPYYVGQNQMAFGKPTRYLKLDPSEAQG